jgi:hypothetical protein
MGLLMAAFEGTFPRDRALTVYWHGEEIAGTLLYGLRSPGPRPPANPSEGWPARTKVSEPWLLHGNDWAVDLWTLRFEQIPGGGAWRAVLESTLVRLVAAGYSVAWFGLEGDFVDPPMLFDPSVMEAVYAASSHETGFICRDQGTEDLRVLTDADLMRLRDAAIPVWSPVDSEPE